MTSYQFLQAQGSLLSYAPWQVWASIGLAFALAIVAAVLSARYTFRMAFQAAKLTPEAIHWGAAEAARHDSEASELCPLGGSVAVWLYALDNAETGQMTVQEFRDWTRKALGEAYAARRCGQACGR